MIIYNFKSLQNRFQATLASLVQPWDKKFVVALSGGSDSTALMHLMLTLRDHFGFELIAAHLDHGLRGSESERDRRFAENLADGAAIEFYWEHTDCRALSDKLGLSLEEAARRARYEFYDRIINRVGADYLATGHTADDQAETVLMNLIRGSGSRGLAGIPPVRGRIIRPCLSFWRDELRAYLTASGVGWVEDSSNMDHSFLRNRVRRELLPLLQRDYNPAMKTALYRSAVILTEEEAVWNRLVSEIRPEIGWRRDGDRIWIDRKRLLKQDRGLARRIVRAAFEAVTGTTRRLSLSHVEDTLELAETRDSGRIDLPDGMVAQVYRNELAIGRSAPPSRPDFEYPLEHGVNLAIHELGLVIRTREADLTPDVRIKGLVAHEAVLDLDRIEGPLTVRLPRPGDRFHPLGLSGTKKLSDFFIDAHVPRWRRNQTPLVLDDRGIVWIVGHRPDDRVKVRPDTKRVLKMEAAALEPDTASSPPGSPGNDG